MTYTCSYDYEIMQLPFTGGTLCVLPNVTTKLGDYKGALQVSPKVHVELVYFEIRFLSLRLSERYLWALSVMHIIISLARNVNNDLVAG